MWNGIASAQNMNIIPGIAPASNTTGALYIEPVDLDLVNWVTFLVQWGAATSGAGATCDDYTVTVECSSVATMTSASAINFTYRLSPALATNSGFGDVTAGTSDGVTLSTNAANLTNKILIVDVDPVEVARRSAVARFLTLHLIPSTTTAHIVGGMSFVGTRYPSNSIPSSS